MKWTGAEDSLLRGCYARAGAARVAALTGRTVRAVHLRARILGVKARPAWTVAEDRLLRLEWGELSSRTLREKLPRRRWSAIIRRAYELGLGRASRGRVSIAEVAAMAGYSHATARRILAAEGVRVEHHPGGPRAGARRTRWLLVDPDEARAAVERWLARETIAQAARRLGVSRWAVCQALRRAGAHQATRRGSAVRYDPAVVDAAVRGAP